MSKDIKRMTYEERVKWHEEHLADAYSFVWTQQQEITLGCALNGYVGEYSDSKLINDQNFELVKFELNNFLYSSPYKEQNICKQEWKNCDLKDIHEELRYNPYETGIFCLIKDGRICKKYYLKGFASFISEKVKIEYFDEAKEMGASVYHLHNHPSSLAAIPSNGDLNEYKRLLKHAEEKNIPINFGIISNEDYWDYEQGGENFEEIMKAKDKMHELILVSRECDNRKELSMHEILLKIKETATK